MESAMAELEHDREGTGERVPLGQRIYENPFLLLAAGIAVMVIFYTLWGLVEVMSLPQAPLP
jgi:hypothetical protein